MFTFYLSKTKSSLIIIGLLIFFLSFSREGLTYTAHSAINKGNKSFEKGDYTRAVEEYQKALKKDPESEIINFNLGTALYKQEQYDQAIEHLRKALLSEDEKLRQPAHFNLGNAFYQKGLKEVQQNLKNAVELLENSLQHFQYIKERNNEDQEAGENYDIVKTKLEELKKQLEQQQQSQKGQSGKDDQNQESQDKKEQQSEQNNDQSQQQPSANQEQTKSPDDSSQPEEDPAQSQDQEEQSDSAPDQSEQQKQEQQSQQNGENENQQNAAPYDPADTKEGELTPKEAQMLIESYQQSEEPKGLLNLFKKQGDRSTSFKDW